MTLAVPNTAKRWPGCSTFNGDLSITKLRTARRMGTALYTGCG